jgi:hypothetical protein
MNIIRYNRKDEFKLKNRKKIQKKQMKINEEKSAPNISRNHWHFFYFFRGTINKNVM